ncbi:MAG TPA: OPT/YSL family transporter, partial [Candidatus Thermoplasmatota archaeon]|nr:OPT/YSL family transporter [Candidatus Thermoplasmatota archaeon]
MAATAQRAPARRAKVSKAKAAVVPAPAAVATGPYVPASRVLPEMTARALLLGIGLAVLLGAANMYVGLRAGLTVSATIPAAVMTMAILRFF